MLENSENIQLLTDEELVKKIIENNYYFPYLIERYEKKLLRYIHRISSLKEEDCEDILQDVFFKVYKNLNSFSSNLKFSAWIYRITHNTVISNYRKIKARPKEIYEKEDQNLWNQFISNLKLENEIENQLLNKQILNILNKLDYKYKEVLILKYLEEKDYQEISDIIQKPVSTVGTLLNRAKKKFKEIVEKNHINF